MKKIQILKQKTFLHLKFMCLTLILLALSAHHFPVYGCLANFVALSKLASFHDINYSDFFYKFSVLEPKAVGNKKKLKILNGNMTTINDGLHHTSFVTDNGKVYFFDKLTKELFLLFDYLENTEIKDKKIFKMLLEEFRTNISAKVAQMLKASSFDNEIILRDVRGRADNPEETVETEFPAHFVMVVTYHTHSHSTVEPKPPFLIIRTTNGEFYISSFYSYNG